VSLSRPSQAGGEGKADADGAGASYSPRSPSDWTPADFAPPVPEALASPALLQLQHAQILGDPFNIRGSLPSVVRLAWSIYQHGLLENLLVVEIPREQRKPGGPEFELRAGSRRFEAMRRLIEEGVEPPPGHPDRELGLTWRWPPDKTISVLVLGSEGHYEHLIENVERSEPYPWEIGRRLNEILSAGVPSRELGTRLGRSGGWVTRYAHIGRGLAPELIDILRREKAEVRMGELAQLAAIRDPYGDPDADKQIELYRARRQKRRRRPRRVDPHSFRATLKRLQYLRGDMPVPALLRPVVSAVISYLEEGTRPEFKTLEERLFAQVEAHSPRFGDDEVGDSLEPDLEPA